MELIVSCFEMDGWADHELNYFLAPDPAVDRYCSKATGDLVFARSALNRRPDLWMICMVRDPRDVVVSRHRQVPDAYFAPLGISLERMTHLRAARDNPRFIILRYEDLAADPDAVQRQLEAAIPFLKRRHDFSKFHEVAQPTERSVRALSGVRQIGTTSVARWRTELPRLKAQIERFGDMDDMLRELGYEADAAWRSCLDTVVPGDASSFLDRRDISARARLKRKKKDIRLLYLKLRHDLGFPARHEIITVLKAGVP